MVHNPPYALPAPHTRNAHVPPGCASRRAVLRAVWELSAVDRDGALRCWVLGGRLSTSERTHARKSTSEWDANRNVPTHGAHALDSDS